MHPGRTRIAARSYGFSLVELMIALTISLVVLDAAGRIVLGVQRSLALQDRLGRMQENGRFAMATIAADLRRAGYWGGTADVRNIVDHTPAGTRNGNRVASDDGTCTGADWARMLTRRIFGKNDNRTGYACLKPLPAGVRHAGDILVVRYAAPRVVGGRRTPEFRARQLYLRSTLFSARLFLGRDQAANDISGGTLPRTAELVSHGYYVQDTDAPGTYRCGGTAVPALYRLGLVNGSLRSEEIVRGVEQFQVRYGLDRDDDGSVDEYIDAPPAADTVRWDRVIAARIWLLLRADCPESNYTNANVYRMGNIVYPPIAHADGFRRLLFTGTVALRN